MKTKIGLLAAVVIAAAGVLAAAASAAAPSNTSPPTISGTLKTGSTLTANEGSWSNTPTSYTYQWQRCASDGRACGDITSATARTYAPVNGDVGRALRVVVTAVNADGKSSATSNPTDPISSAGGPSNTVRPALAGTATVGSSLRVTNGSWSPSPSSFGRQWQRCESDGTGCLNIAGATGASYGVRSADVGHRLRALVTARTASGSTIVTSAASEIVGGTTTTTTTSTTTTVVTTTAPGNRAPSLGYVSLRIVGARAYARFRICDDKHGGLTVVERDSKNRVLSVSRRFHVALGSSCAVFARSWKLKAKFRTRGRYVSSLRAVDGGGRLSLLRTRSVRFR
jgi:ribosomal protein S14